MHFNVNPNKSVLMPSCMSTCLTRFNLHEGAPKWEIIDYICDMCHEKTDLKVFVVVIPKEGWAPIDPSFGMTLTFQNLTLLTS